jgi:hypothetical protein
VTEVGKLVSVFATPMSRLHLTHNILWKSDTKTILFYDLVADKIIENLQQKHVIPLCMFS